MTWIIYLTVFSFLFVVYLYRKGIRDSKNMVYWDIETSGLYSNRKYIFYHQIVPSSNIREEKPITVEDRLEDLIDENSPENIDFDKTLNILRLRNKLNKIEEEKGIPHKRKE